ncbi:MAG: hypothetical protein LQ350_007999 [Teloschistes chrysophthalmus]|nr:MAG: hypothetical protein LQ350_007999 [Niorma chrysophthalma]
MPPWNPILGHLCFCYKIASALPKDAHPNYLPDMIRRQMPELGSIFYLDTWPFGPQMLVVASAAGLYQITQQHPLPKYHALKHFLKPISEGLDIVTMEGDMWKTWRGIFNPGFSASHLMTLTEDILRDAQRFCDTLEKRCEDGQMFKMKDLTDNLTMDIIGKVVLDVRLNSQEQINPLVEGLRMQVRWLSFGAEANPFARYNPLRALIHWYNTRRMNNYVSQEIDARYERLRRSDRILTAGGKSIIDLVLTAYRSGDATTPNGNLDPVFKRFTMNQIKLFLFSGHDTTSSTVCYIFYVLITKPAVLRRLRAEHDSVLGRDTAQSAALLQNDPYLLNQLPFTTGVIKETLRLYPAVSSTRAGEPGFNVIDQHHRQFPTDGFLVWANSQAIHRDPTYWHQADEFIPERWTVSADDVLHPIKGAWRPFEHGPRNCIGQELAMIEMKIITIMAARKFDFKLAYEKPDGVNASKEIKTVYGERGYQIQRAQPSDDLPCWVTKQML